MMEDDNSMELFKEVKKYVEEVGRWPPRHRRGDLGSRIQVFLRRTNDAEASERAAIITLEKNVRMDGPSRL